MSQHNRNRFARTEREAFQSKHNPQLTPRLSRFSGSFADTRRFRWWRLLKQLIMGN